jgi:hypothetical protein
MPELEKVAAAIVAVFGRPFIREELANRGLADAGQSGENANQWES